MHGPTARTARWTLLALYLLVIGLPIVLSWRVLDSSTTLAGWFALVTGLLACSMLVVTVILMARLPFLVSAFGIETTLLLHRLSALTVVVLVVAHIGLVLGTDPRGWSVLDLRTTTSAAVAATLSTALLVVLVALALRRKRKQPRYEDWRLTHIGLAATALLTAWLHIWWLNHLRSDLLLATWFLVLAAVLLGLAARRWVWLPWRAHRRSYVVEELTPGPGNSVTLALRAHGHGGMPFRPGQFAWLKVGSSSFDFEEHPFSISSTAESPHRKEFTIKALGDFSSLIQELAPGRRVFLDGPYGQFTIEGLDGSPGFVFVAGGVGLTPMVSMLRTLRDRGDLRTHYLLVGSRTVEEIMLRDEVAGLRDGLDVRVVEVIESPPEGWTGETGRIDGDLLARSLPRLARHYDYFVCGPPMMVTAVGRLLRERGVAPRRIHTERFEVV